MTIPAQGNRNTERIPGSTEVRALYKDWKVCGRAGRASSDGGGHESGEPGNQFLTHWKVDSTAIDRETKRLSHPVDPHINNKMLSSCAFRSTRAASRPLRLAKACQLRSYAIAAHDVSDPKLTTIDGSKLSITKTTTPKELIPSDELVFGRHFTDHMLSLEWTAQDGWQAPRITPYQNLSLDPATCVFHYAFECFEGMKAYKDEKGNIRLFRPDKNMARLNRSSARIALPNFDSKAMIDLIAKFVKVDERFIPR